MIPKFNNFDSKFEILLLFVLFQGQWTLIKFKTPVDLVHIIMKIDIECLLQFS